MWMQIGRAMGEVRVNGNVYESPNGVTITGSLVTDAVTGQPVQPRPEEPRPGK